MLALPRPWGDLLALALTGADQPDAPAEPVRDRILRLVREFPGIHLSELCRQLDIRAGHAQHHLRTLEATGQVTRTKDQRYQRFWPTQESAFGQLPVLAPAERDLLQYVRRPPMLRILVNLCVEGPLQLSELARHCKLAPSTVHHHLQRLQDAGLVARPGEARTEPWDLADQSLVRRLLREYEPPPRTVAGFLDVWSRLRL